jgi:hypothetical protein
MVDDVVTATALSPTAQRGVRERFWFQALAVVVLLAAFGLILLRVSHRDVVQDWAVLASCPAPAGTAPATVSTTLDTSACATTPSHSVSGRGWPIVPFVVSDAGGVDPTITAVHSDKAARTMSVDYDAPTAATAPGHGVVLVFVEVPFESLPATPFTIDGASGPVSVSSLPHS